MCTVQVSVKERVAHMEQAQVATQPLPLVPRTRGHRVPDGRFGTVQTKIALFSKNPDVVIGYFLVDSACARTVGGKPWKEAMTALCDKHGVDYRTVAEHEPFRFGPGKRMY